MDTFTYFSRFLIVRSEAVYHAGQARSICIFRWLIPPYGVVGVIFVKAIGLGCRTWDVGRGREGGREGSRGEALLGAPLSWFAVLPLQIQSTPRMRGRLPRLFKEVAFPKL